MQHHTSAREPAQFLPAFSIFIFCHRLEPSTMTSHQHSPALTQGEPWDTGAAWSREDDTGERGGGWWVEVTSSTSPLPMEQGETTCSAGMKPRFPLPAATQGVSTVVPHGNDSGSQCWPALMVFIKWNIDLSSSRASSDTIFSFLKGWQASKVTIGDGT